LYPYRKKIALSLGLVLSRISPIKFDILSKINFENNILNINI